MKRSMFDADLAKLFHNRASDDRGSVVERKLLTGAFQLFDQCQNSLKNCLAQANVLATSASQSVISVGLFGNTASSQNDRKSSYRVQPG